MTPRPAPILSTIAVVQARLGLGRTKVLELIRAQDLEAVKCGRRVLITEDSITQLVGRLPRVGHAAQGTSK